MLQAQTGAPQCPRGTGCIDTGGHGCSGDGVNFGFPPGSCKCPNNISMFRTVCYGAGYGGSNCLSRTTCAPFCDDCLVSTPCHIETDYNTPCLSVERPCDSCPRE